MDIVSSKLDRFVLVIKPIVNAPKTRALVLGAFTMGLITRTNRSSLLETMSMDYIRTARAKGLGETAVVIRHAFGNAFIPVITVIGLGFGNLLGGAVLVETIFSWP